MIKACTGLVILFCSSGATATDFGIRTLGGPLLTDGGSPVTSSPVDIGSAKRIGAQWGRVTSTHRSPEHNRRVGGVPNSYHLSGRAIDIARRPGVSHGQIAAAYRQAGYHLLESLDEGDHSHFAFGGGSASIRSASTRSLVTYGSRRSPEVRPLADSRSGEMVHWKVVYAPRSEPVRPARLEVVGTPVLQAEPAGGSVLTLATMVAGAAGEAPRN